MIHDPAFRRLGVWAASGALFLAASLFREPSASADVTCNPIAPALLSGAAGIGATTLVVPAVVELADSEGELSYLTVVGWTAAGSATGATMGIVTSTAVVRNCSDLEAMPIVAPALGALSVGIIGAALSAAFTGDDASFHREGRVAAGLPAFWAVPTASSRDRPDGAMVGLAASF